MPAQPPDTQPMAQNEPKGRARHMVISNQVMKALGQPHELYTVQVRPLWENNYRVNVLVGENAAAAKVAHSYFLVADGDGNVIAATPNIQREY